VPDAASLTPLRPAGVETLRIAARHSPFIECRHRTGAFERQDTCSRPPVKANTSTKKLASLDWSYSRRARRSGMQVIEAVDKKSWNGRRAPQFRK
jgi:hypothetical protein